MSTRTVLISGAGIAGPTAAFWLRAAGFTPTLVERAPALRTGGYVVDFWGLGYDIAERMGLKPQLDRVGYHVREMRIVGARGRRVAGFGTGVFGALTGGRYVTLARSDLSRLLFETAARNTEVMLGDEIVALRERPDHVEVGFRHGGTRRFDLVIGADGLHSAVRGLAFGDEKRFERQLGYHVAAFEVRGYRPRDEDVYLMYNVPGRMLGRFTLHDDRTLFLFVWAEDALRDASGCATNDLAGQKARLHQVYSAGAWETGAILAALDRTPELYFDRVSQIVLNRWSRGRIALIGDAAFCVSLLAGQGSALAMTAAYVLAGELAAADGDHALGFASYESRLRAFIAGKQRGAAGFASAFAPRTSWGLLARNLIINLFAVPGLARLAVGREITDRLRLPDYGWTTSRARAAPGETAT
jgi:2-polyprenyl-6-methoxyphenol hydroxylase-like FAD-dependent oxidoreductase